MEGDGPIHALVKRKSAGKSGRRLKQNYLVSLLTYSDAFVDHPNESGMTALHLAAQVNGPTCYNNYRYNMQFVYCNLGAINGVHSIMNKDNDGLIRRYVHVL